jgi:hypothetical protein
MQSGEGELIFGWQCFSFRFAEKGGDFIFICDEPEHVILRTAAVGKLLCC